MKDSERLNTRIGILGKEIVRIDASPKDHVGALVVADAILELARQLALLREEGIMPRPESDIDRQIREQKVRLKGPS